MVLCLRMQNIQTEYLIILPIEQISLHTQYTAGEQLPLHCTVLPWFTLAAGYNRERLMQDIDLLCTSYVSSRSIELVAHKPACFGPRHDVPVHVLKDNNNLQELHKTLLLRLSGICHHSECRQWIGAGYQPHVTTVGDRVFAPGTRYLADSMALIERTAQRTKAVVAIYRFTYN